jgi:hypothetical protein
MNIKVRLEPKVHQTDVQLAQKMRKEAEDKIKPKKEKSLEELLFGEEKIDESISKH